MPIFTTPKPITAAIDIVVGDVQVFASDREDTVVEVRPSDASREQDVRVAEQTRVEYSAGRLLIKGHRSRAMGLFGKVGSIDVRIELPTGSDLEGDASVAAFRSSGRLGECRIKTATGDLRLEDTGPLDLETGAGLVTVNHVAGDATVSTGTGKVRLAQIDGNAVIKNSNGDNWVGEIQGELRANTANGDITVDQAHDNLTAATANGDLRVGEVVRGSVSLKTAMGQIEIGIRIGTAARVEARTAFGRVRNQLESVSGPEPSDQMVDVRAQTSYGDIVIRRS